MTVTVCTYKFYSKCSRKLTENLIKEINLRFISLLDKDNTQDVAQDILDRMTNITPIGKKLQLIINERSEQLDDEETRQLISIQNFYQRRITSQGLKLKLIGNLMGIFFLD